jgi:hypothetical protein
MTIDILDFNPATALSRTSHEQCDGDGNVKSTLISEPIEIALPRIFAQTVVTTLPYRRICRTTSLMYDSMAIDENGLIGFKACRTALLVIQAVLSIFRQDLTMTDRIRSFSAEMWGCFHVYFKCEWTSPQWNAGTTSSNPYRDVYTRRWWLDSFPCQHIETLDGRFMIPLRLDFGIVYQVLMHSC